MEIVIATNWSDINDNGRSACQNVSASPDDKTGILVLICSFEPILGAWSSLDILEMLEKLTGALSGYFSSVGPSQASLSANLNIYLKSRSREPVCP